MMETTATTEEQTKFNYMMLSRLISDCEYFLGWGKRNPKRLWADNVNEHIAEMRRLYNVLVVKPEWISMYQILLYQNRMERAE